MSEIWSRYGATSARPGGPAGRDVRPSGMTIDIHSHILVQQAADYVRPHLHRSATLATAETQALGTKQHNDRLSRLTTMDERLRDLDEMAIDVQVVKPAPNQCYYGVPTEIGVTAARMVNDGVAEYVARRPDRFVPFGTVPLQDGNAAAAELERCVRQLGFKGVQVLTNVEGAELSDVRFAPFWAMAEKLGTLVVIHPAGYTEPQRLTRFYFGNVIGNPLDTTVALHYLIFDGVLERHPDLKILAVHGGGYLPAYSGRMDHAWGARSDAYGALLRPPTFYLRKIWFDTIVFTPHQLENLVRVFGAGRILMGTDYPYDMGEYNPIGHVAGVASFDAATVAAIAGDNAGRLLGL
jgi:aminocarboxymuconate-semialdehyde decarboxylase